MLKRGLALAFLFLVTLTVSAPWATSQQEGAVPAYNAAPAAEGRKASCHSREGAIVG